MPALNDVDSGLISQKFQFQLDEEISSNKSMKMNCFEVVPARLVLYFLSWSGFLVSFMMRNDINFALVVMVKTRNATQLSLNGNEAENVSESPNYVKCTTIFLRNLLTRIFLLVIYNRRRTRRV